MNPLSPEQIPAVRQLQTICERLKTQVVIIGAMAYRVWVRDMKNPGDKKGNHVLCELTPEAIQIIDSMPRVADEIFPFTTGAISAGFTRACRQLGISDLHFHDLRHEGISRLFEMGRTIPQVAAVSGHRSWSSLQRYTHIRETGDKFKGWNWLKIISSHSLYSVGN